LNLYRLVLTLATTPCLVLIFRDLTTSGFEKQLPEQKATIILVLLSILYYNPALMLVPIDHYAVIDLVQSVIEDLVLTFMVFHSIFILGRIVDFSKMTLFGRTAPYAAATLAFVFFLLGHWDPDGIEHVRAHPTATFDLEFSRMNLFMLFVYAGLWYQASEATKKALRESHRSRYRYYLFVESGTLVVLSAALMIQLIGGPIIQTAILDVLPLVLCFGYTSLMYHGHKKLDDTSVFLRKRPDDVALVGEYSEDFSQTMPVENE
jgi:hypothetical protein